MTIAPQTKLEVEEQVVTEAFAGTLTLLPQTTTKRMKVRAFFTQKVMRSGAFSFSPVLSFHAIIPDDSEVFRLVEGGDIEGLTKLLQRRSASLTDCDTKGRSLLGVRFPIPNHGWR